MVKFLLTILLFFISATRLPARSISIVLKPIYSGTLSAADVNNSSLAHATTYDQPRRYSSKGAITHYDIRQKRSKRYDVTRETGAYFFDTVYKLRMPAAKRINVSLNGGYTCYDRYVRGVGPGGGSLGVVGGASVMINPFGQGGGLWPKKGFIRLSAELSSYPYRKGVPGDGPKTPLLDKYTRELTTRLYVDARITWRTRRGAFTSRCMVGIKEGAEDAVGAAPFFVGAGIGYRFL